LLRRIRHAPAIANISSATAPKNIGLSIAAELMITSVVMQPAAKATTLLLII